VALHRRFRELLLFSLIGALFACGWLPPDSPPAKPVAPDPDTPLFHDWKITGHVLGADALISELDAAGFHGRTVAVSATGYASPWSGSCDNAHRQKEPRRLAELADQLKLPRDRAASLALGEPIVEYQLSCAGRPGGVAGNGRTPPLTCYVAGDHAVTCWSGVCYLLAR
jgi:hypothetical protein